MEVLANAIDDITTMMTTVRIGKPTEARSNKRK